MRAKLGTLPAIAALVLGAGIAHGQTEGQKDKEKTDEPKATAPATSPEVQPLAGADIAIRPEVLAPKFRRDVQRKLESAGHYEGAIDGNFGARTESALLSFQRANGLTPTGKLDVGTARALGVNLFVDVQPVAGEAAATPMTPENKRSQKPKSKTMAKGKMIREAQQALIERGYLAGPADGVMGDETKSALRAFQQANGLEQTGHLDMETKRALGIGVAAPPKTDEPKTDEPKPDEPVEEDTDY